MALHAQTIQAGRPGGVPQARSPATAEPEIPCPAVRSRLLVPDLTAAERVAIELVRNHLIAHPARNLAVAGSAELPALGAFLRQARPVFAVTTRPLPRGRASPSRAPGPSRRPALTTR